MGVAAMDEDVTFELTSTLASSVKRKARKVPHQRRQHAQPQAAHANSEKNAPSAAAGGSAAAPKAASGDSAAGECLQQVSRLRCDVAVRVRLRVPPPLSAVPGPLLSTTGGLLAKLVMQALLPTFLDLLAVDYARWAAGDASRRTSAAGSLVPSQPVQPHSS